jgi:preprotein translocase subunit SecD
MVEHVITRVETQLLELQVSHSTWLHTAEDQLKVTDNQVQTAQVLTIEQELAQAEADRANGLTLGAAEAAVVAQEEQEIKLMCSSLTQVGTQVTLVDQETHQKVHQVVDQVQLTQMIQHTDHTVVVEDQDFTD